MNKMTRTAAMLTTFVLLYAGNANAISHAYRAQLEREHKTQVQDVAHTPSRSNELRAAGRDADATVNAPIGNAADFLLSQGWKANNGDWHKGKFIIRLVVEDGVVVNAQVM